MILPLFLLVLVKERNFPTMAQQKKSDLGNEQKIEILVLGAKKRLFE